MPGTAFLLIAYRFCLRRILMKRLVVVPAVLCLGLTLAGCGSTTGERVGSGAAMGAAAGGIIGSMSGSWGAGAAIGAATGAVGGYVVDQNKKGNID
jgi:uncharacterized protein YcfJ